MLLECVSADGLPFDACHAGGAGSVAAVGGHVWCDVSGCMRVGRDHLQPVRRVQAATCEWMCFAYESLGADGSEGDARDESIELVVRSEMEARLACGVGAVAMPPFRRASEAQHGVASPRNGRMHARAQCTQQISCAWLRAFSSNSHIARTHVAVSLQGRSEASGVFLPGN
mmetsp:Transcript_53478/g.106400  ORF Transcript_53478/g.106400 Transcript_53478/m.106400 type:complete len:171 (+) Transcript_53478:3091-3603(+)